MLEDISNMTLTGFSRLASTEGGGSGDLFSALGIDWKMLVLQILAFAVLVFILAKFVYPPLLAMLDRRDKMIEESTKAAKEAEKKASESQAQTAELLAKARSEASDIVTTARDEAAGIALDAEESATKKADAIVANAAAQIEKDVEAARKMLRNETADLVAMATEKVVKKKVDAKEANQFIDESLREKK